MSLSGCLGGKREVEVIEYSGIELGNVGGCGCCRIRWVYNGG